MENLEFYVEQLALAVLGIGAIKYLAATLYTRTGEGSERSKEHVTTEDADGRC